MKKLNININGNKKLRNTDKIRFMIWNLPAVKTCPFATEMCKKSCYARKAEKCYPSVLPSRERNYAESLTADFVENMIFTIESELKTRKYAGKKVVFRIHESGDFYNLAYTEKWIDIARYFENDDRIVFLAYTKSIWYFVNLGYGYLGFPRNLVVRSSIWADTAYKNLWITENYQFPIYTALTASEMTEQSENGRVFTRCECDDCANCGDCWNAEKRDIICEIH